MIKASRMYRMPENNQEVKRFWAALEVFFFFSMQITYPITYFPSNWNILTFFYHFSIWFVSFYIILCKLSSFMRIYAFKKKKKNFEETLCLQPRQFASTLLHLHLYANYCSSAGFRWRQKRRFWIPRWLPFWAPFLFWLSRFYKLSFRLFIPTF